MVPDTKNLDGAPPRAGRREWIGLGVIALACMLYVMDLTVLHLAIPAISTDLQPSSAQLLWIIDIYGFVVAGSLITMGTLGDRIGRRRLLMIGAAAFGAASVLAALSTSAEMLIGTRALLGIAGATIAPSTLSLIRNMFLDPEQRTRAIAVWITSFSVGAAIGPLLGGLVLEFFWWGAAFLINVPVMVLLLILGPRLLPEYKDPNAGRLDIPSAALSLVAILAVIFGLKQFAQDGIGWLPVLSIALGLAIGAVFVRRQRRLDDPLIDLGLFRVPAFTSSLFLYGFGILMVFGGFLFVPQYLQLVLGLSPLEAGLWTLPWALAFVVGSQVTPKLAQRFAPTTIMAAGLALAALGFVVFTQVDAASGLRDDRDRVGRVLPRYGPRLHADERPDHRVRPSRTSRCRRRDLGDRRPSSEGRSASRSSAASVSRSTGTVWPTASRPGSRRRARRSRRTRSAARSRWRGSFPPSSALRCSRPRTTRSSAGCTSSP